MVGRRFLTESGGDIESIVIQGEEYHHLVHVMRAGLEMDIEAVNGRGEWFRARITRITSSRVEARITERIEEPRPEARLILAPSILKKRPMDLLIEKLCELGVDEIRPLRFDRTDADFSEKTLQRWHRVAMQTLKVNRRLWMTRIHPPIPLKQLIANPPEGATRFFLDIQGSVGRITSAAIPAICVVGPPGDFSQKEHAALEEAGFTPWNINSGVLRSETATVAAAALMGHALVSPTP